MKVLENQVTYETTNSYTTLNALTEKTKNVWIVFHGIGYLSKYFLKYFDELPSNENYIIAPQAPSKYYLNNQYRHVGASWLTKENTANETQNVLNYLDAVYNAVNIPADCKLIIFGYSQGVSIATRWVVKRQLDCQQLILYAGGIPKELTPRDFKFIIENNTNVTTLVGNKDEYINAAILQSESERITDLFSGNANQVIFQGKHEIKKELLNQFL
ncbi:MAG: esterase [Maribacter sp.]|nr:esterase [Maribacter sp.]